MRKTNVRRGFALFLLAALLPALFAGCGGKDNGPPVITFTNESSYLFMEIYISPTETGVRGPDVLGGTNVLKSGGSVSLGPEAKASDNIYDIRCLDTDGDFWVFQRVPITRGTALTVVLSDSYDPALQVRDAKGGVMEISGQFLDSNGSDPGDTEGGNEEWSDPGDTEDYIPWIEFTLLNSTSYKMYEAYFAPGGTIEHEDNDAVGYNHLASIIYLAPDEDTSIGVDDYGFIDVLLVDEDGDVWAFRDCVFADGCMVEIASGQMLIVRYSGGEEVRVFDGEIL